MQANTLGNFRWTELAMFVTNSPMPPSQLRWFGLSLGGLVCCFAAISFWRFDQRELALGLAGFACLLVAVYYLMPSTQTRIVRGFRTIVWPIQAVVSIVLLGILFFGVILPIGLLLRGLGRDPLVKRADPDKASYWEPYPTTTDTKRYFRTY